MTAYVKVKPTLPKDEESNGLGAQAAKDILADELKPRVGIVVMQAEGGNWKNDTGEKVPHMRILRIELVTDSEEADNLIQRAQALSEVRTGNSPLPGTKGKAEAALDFDGDDFPDAA